MFPLIANPGAVFAPKARVYIVNDAREVLAGPLVLSRRRAYHREWLLAFEGITGRDAVEPWRDQLVAVEDVAGADG